MLLRLVAVVACAPSVALARKFKDIGRSIGMDQHVSGEVRMCKVLLANLALVQISMSVIGFGFRVGDHVLLEITAVFYYFTTCSTHNRPLSRVSPHVFDEIIV